MKLTKVSSVCCSVSRRERDCTRRSCGSLFGCWLNNSVSWCLEFTSNGSGSSKRLQNEQQIIQLTASQYTQLNELNTNQWWTKADKPKPQITKNAIRCAHYNPVYMKKKIQLFHPSFRYSTVGRRSFPVAAYVLWNSLPLDIQSSPSLTVFRQRLKTFLFRKSFPHILL